MVRCPERSQRVRSRHDRPTGHGGFARLPITTPCVPTLAVRAVAVAVLAFALAALLSVAGAAQAGTKPGTSSAHGRVFHSSAGAIAARTYNLTQLVHAMTRLGADHVPYCWGGGHQTTPRSRPLSRTRARFFTGPRSK